MYFLTFILKNLVRRKVRSLLTVTGVAVAVMAVVSLVGISDGFERSLINLYEHRGVDLLVLRAGSTVRLSSSLPEQIGEQIKQLPHVRTVSPGLLDVVDFRDAGLISVPVQGWTVDSFMFDELHFKEGRRLQAGDDQGVMLGYVLAGNLGKHAGDSLEIASQTFKVIGIYESFNSYENASVVMLLGVLQTLQDRPQQVTGFQVVVEDAADKKAAIDEVRRRIEELQNPKGQRWGIAATPVRDYVKTTVQIRTAHAMAWITSVIALVIGAIGVLNTMIMSVFERTHEIGILRAIGWRRSRVLRLILYEAVILSLVGASVGVVAAVLVTAGLSELPIVNGMIEGRIALPILLVGFAVALTVGLIGGAYPAYRGATLLPIEALRHE